MDTNTRNIKAEAQDYLQRWADMEVVGVVENADGSVDLELVSPVLGNLYEVHITSRRVG